MKKQKFIAAMSGGVDSTVAAALYHKIGHEVIGVTLRMKPQILDDKVSQSCCSTDDEIQAKMAADKLGIEHRIIESREDFYEKVLRKSWNEYRVGRTPNPCTVCNYLVKFAQLIEYAKEIGADGVITGHYAKIVKNDDGLYAIERGDDSNKDQTYFLYNLRQEQIAMVRFPVGDISKNEVREIARDFEFANSEKKDSQDACFLYEGHSFPESLRLLFRQNPAKGSFVDENGKVLGRHEGIHNYTIGQRKGLKIALGKPAYVKEIDGKSRAVTLTTDSDQLLKKSFFVHNINYQSGIVRTKPFECLIQVRYRSKAVAGKVVPIGDGAIANVVLDAPVRAITAGQSAVFYDGNTLLGGGVISFDS